MEACNRFSNSSLPLILTGFNRQKKAHEQAPCPLLAAWQRPPQVARQTGLAVIRGRGEHGGREESRPAAGQRWNQLPVAEFIGVGARISNLRR